jgi:uncharacterized protein YaiL (DUF2058 family)
MSQFKQLTKNDLLDLREGDIFLMSHWDGKVGKDILTVDTTKINAKGNFAIRYSYYCDYRQRTCYGNVVIGKGFNEKGEQRLYSDSCEGRVGTRTYYKQS